MAQSPKVVRYLWIRIALFEKHLASILEHVVQNSYKYYEKNALVSDPVGGQIFASLLVGPCALDYSKMRTQDQYWNDPPADELVQRHRISSIVSTNSVANISQSTPPSTRKPLALTYKKSHILNNTDLDEMSNSPCSIGSPSLRSMQICWSPRDYVESLHQNSKSTLLYGKNNVIIQPKDDMEPMPGYLSLHQDSTGIIVKWTPNQLINGRNSFTDNGSADSMFNNSFDKKYDHVLVAC